MKRIDERMFRLWVGCLLLVGLCGCQSDDEEGAVPEVNAMVTLTLDKQPMPPLSRAAFAVGDYCYRVTVAMFDGNREEGRYTYYEPIDQDPTATQMRIPFTLNLHPRLYKMAVWADFVQVREGNETDSVTYSAFYNVQNMELVVRTPYRANTDYLRAYYGLQELDLRDYGGGQNISVPVAMELTCPMARYELVATDVEEFLRQKTEGELADLRDERLNYNVSYDWFLNTGFNVLTGEPRNPLQYIEYTQSVHAHPVAGDEPVIAFDYVFVNGEDDGFFTIDVEVAARFTGESTDRVIGRIANLQVPYEQNYNTTFRANFLTGNSSFEIDTDFEGEFDVDLDELPGFGDLATEAQTETENE